MNEDWKAYCCGVLKDEAEYKNIHYEEKEGNYYIVIRTSEQDVKDGLGSGVPLYHRKMNFCYHCGSRLARQ